MLTFEIMGVCLLIVTMGVGLDYQVNGWKLGGAHLIFVCVLIINYVILPRFQLYQALARVDELEKKVATSGTTDG